MDKKLVKFNCEELIRLDEAINCFYYRLFYASVVMSVSAVEARLIYLFKNADPKLYVAEFQKATIGRILQVIGDTDHKKEKYKKVKKLLPKNHHALVDLLNYLRTNCAHPKEEIAYQNTAETALKLSFSFLLDDAVKIRARSRKKFDNN